MGAKIEFLCDEAEHYREENLIIVWRVRSLAVLKLRSMIVSPQSELLALKLPHLRNYQNSIQQNKE